MVKKLLTGVAFCALATSAYAGTPESGGSVGVNVGLRSCMNTDDVGCKMHVVTGIDGTYQYAFLGNFSVQADLHLEKYSGMQQSDDQVDGASTAGVHFAWRNDSFLVGAYGSAAKAGVYDDHTGQAYGAEFQWYTDAVTYYGTYGYADINYDNLDNRFQGIFALAEARYFISDDTMLSGDLGYGFSPRGYEDAGDTGAITTGGASLTRRWDDTSFYYTLRFESSRYQANSEDVGAEERFVLGVTWMFGSESLKAADRNGATLRTSLLPSRAASWAEAVD